MPHGIADEDWPTFTQMMKDYRDGKFTTSPPVEGTKGPRQTTLNSVVILHSDLTGYNTVTGELLEYRPDSVGYDVQAVGLRASDAGGECRLKIGNWESPPLYGLDSAETVFNILDRSPYASGLLGVTLGSNPAEGNYIARWRMEFAPDVPLLQLTQSSSMVLSDTKYHGTGELVHDLHLAFPTIDPTPVRNGSQCVIAPTLSGFVVIAAEPRNFHFVPPFAGGMP